MAFPKMADKVVETDVLVMGGGVGGCPAAAKAAEHGLNVTLVEKSKPERAGNCAPGMDEIGPFTRDGVTALDLVKHDKEGGQYLDPNVLYKIYDSSLWALEELERFGVTMRWDDGEYYWIPWFLGNDAKNWLRVHWLNAKPEMAAAVRKRGVNVLERTMVVDLLTDKDRVAGATTVNTRTGEFTVIKAKAVVIAAGKFLRHYDPVTPVTWKYKMAYEFFPEASSGDGHAVAYRAGADLTGMEMIRTSDVRDALVMRGGNFAHNDGIFGKVFTWKGEEVSRAPGGPLDYLELARKGMEPLYLSLEHLPDDFQKRIEAHYVDERFLGLKIAEERGFNPRTHRYQKRFTPSNRNHATGIDVDENLKGSLQGVYAIGDCAYSGGIGCAGAAIAGLVVGDNIHRYVSAAGEPALDEAQLESQKRIALAPLAVKDGTEPMELECAIRFICGEYAGMFRSEGRLREGLNRLGSLRREFLPGLMAKNPHYLMRCLEVRNIMDMAELHLQASLARKETRGEYVRLDCPERDPSLDTRRICQRTEKGKAVLESREVPELKPEYAREKK